MGPANTPIDLATVGRVIDGRAWRLAFPPALEAQFEADEADARCRRLIRHNWVGLAIYNAFLIGDFFLLHDIFTFSVILHLCIMTPTMVLVIFVLSRRPPVWLREGVLMAGIVLGTAAILGLMLLSRSPLRTSEHISVVLVILFATMVQRIRFKYVVAACLVSLALYVAALATFVHHDPARMGVADAVFAGVVLFSLIGCYNLEYEQRMSYLLTLRDRLRNTELETLSRHDPLTGVGNRRALDAAIARRRPTVSTDGKPTAVLLFDIDFFKTYNDANGHMAGDDCLRRIAGLISGDVRLDLDRVFRFGGEEFLVLLDDCALTDALAIGERVRCAIESAAIPRGTGYAGVVTVSVGVAAGIVSDTLTMADIVADADAALYAAKRGGRNQVQPDAPRSGARTQAA